MFRSEEDNINVSDGVCSDSLSVGVSFKDIILDIFLLALGVRLHIINTLLNKSTVLTDADGKNKSLTGHCHSALGYVSRGGAMGGQGGQLPHQPKAFPSNFWLNISFIID